MLGRRSLRAFSYGMVAVFAFGLGSATPAFAESGGLPALTAQVQTLVSGIAAEIARATSAEAALGKRVETLSASTANLTAGLATETKRATDAEAAIKEELARRQAEVEARLEARLRAAEERAAAAEARREARLEARLREMEERAAAAEARREARLAALAEEHARRQAEHEARVEARLRAIEEALRRALAEERQYADSLFANAITDIQLDIAKQDIVKEHERAAAAEDALRAQALLAAAKAAEADAATLEKAVSGANAYTDLRFAGALGIGCVTIEKLPGHVVATVGPGNVVTFVCVPNGQ